MTDLKKTNENAVSTASEVESFLQQVESTPLATRDDRRGRLIFALDATASRQSTWDYAASLTGDMFTKTQGLGKLDVQLLYYRGYSECRASGWTNKASTLLRLMNKVACAAGTTQIARVLRHTIAETSSQSVQAVVFIGDCVEEDADKLAQLAGTLRMHSLPLFVFQEGYNSHATEVFKLLARLSGGAHCRFDRSSADQLSQLLNAVAVYATGGKKALKKLAQSERHSASRLLEQLND